MTRLPYLLATLTVAAALGAAVWHGCHGRRSRHAAEEAWEAERTVILAYAAALRARADSAIAARDSLARVAAAAEARADSADRAAQRALARVRAAGPAPDTCRPYTAARDTVIVHLAAESTGLREALAAERSAAERLTVAYALEAARGDSLAAVLLRRPEPDPGWRLLGIRVPPAVETGMRCALPGGVAWAATDELAVGVLVAAACMVAHGW